VSRDGQVSEVDPDFSFQAASQQGVHVALSPDGGRIAYRHHAEPTGDVWIKELDRGPVSRLTFFDGIDGAPAWSEDGRTIYFLSQRDGWGIWSRRADGIGEATLIHAFDGAAMSLQSGPDGWLLYRVQEPSNNMYALNVQSGEVIEVGANDGYAETSAAISPDGRWITYTSNETGQPSVYIRPFPNVNDGRWQIPVDVSAVAKWSDDGSEIYFATLTGISVARVETDPTFRIVETRELFPYPTGMNATTLPGRWDVDGNGQRFLMTRLRLFNMSGVEQKPELILVQNFFEELKERVPR